MQHPSKTKTISHGNGHASEHVSTEHVVRKGLKIDRRFTKPGAYPLDAVTYEKRSSVISNTDGSTVFKMENAEIPKSWSQLATDIVVSKYFRKAGVPGSGFESSARQVVER